MTELSVQETSGNIGSRTFNNVTVYGYKAYWAISSGSSFYFTHRVSADADL